MIGRTKLPSLFYGALIALTAIPASAQTTPNGKFDPPTQARAGLSTGLARVIIRVDNAESLDSVGTAIEQAGGKRGRRLGIINAWEAEVPNAALNGLCNSSRVEHCSSNRPIEGSMERTGPTVGSTAVRQQYGYDGTGIGVAVIDSGVTAWHDDLATATLGAQRVVRFVDFVGTSTTPNDEYGHGSHIAGIIAGNGYDSGGLRAGIAPGASLTVLKALDGSGHGVIGDVIAALDYVVAHRDELHLRVCNLSIATGVYESYNVDPLTLAALQVVKANIVVVAAAGNNGRSSTGTMQYGGITAPGNAPWVLTVGASSHMGTIDRSDDTMAAFSSRGPTAIDASAKPDLVAPGVGIESLSVPNSTLYNTFSAYLLDGTVSTTYKPYLSLSGTSMSTAVVTGTVALMLQANSSLTPNAVKAVLQYTSEQNPGYDPLTEGAGFLNAKGAVDLAGWFAAPSSTYPTASNWSGQIIWGNRQYGGGRFTATANAWLLSTSWGSPIITKTNKQVVFGLTCSAADCSTVTTSYWDVADASTNVVWGNKCNGADCTGTTWTFAAANDHDTVVWGTGAGGDTVVWGTGDGGTVVWGTGGDGDTVVWGTTCGDTSCIPVIWKNQ
jgi:serine protease AprX